MVFHLFFNDIVEYFYLDNSSFFFAQNNMINILGIVSGYSFVSKCFWVDIEDVFVMLDKEKQNSILKLKCGNEQEIIKFIS